MKKSQDDANDSEDLEEKFNRGEDALDYFDLSRARLIGRNLRDQLLKQRLRIR